MREIGHFITGKPVAGTSGKFCFLFYSAEGRVLARVATGRAAFDTASAESVRPQASR